MDKRLLFNEDVINYDKMRPRYCRQLFKDIIEYADISDKKSAIEVGCGSGQATKPFLDTRCSVTAIELGEKFTIYTKEKFREYDNFHIINSSFEDYNFDNTRYDLLYSATAFHWIKPEIAYTKAMQMLKHGGTLALFWNKPSFSMKNDSLFNEIEDVYAEYFHSNVTKVSEKIRQQKYTTIQKTISDYGFTNIKLKLYNNERRMTGIEYVNLLNTYSDHRALPKNTRIKFYDKIRDIIEFHGNLIVIHDTIDLYLGKKP